MAVTVVGSVALDTVTTPAGRNQDGLGGAATFFALGASHFTQVNLVGVVGDDFPAEHIDLFRSHDIDLNGLESRPGKTFRWSGHYHDDLNSRDTLDTQLGVFEGFNPQLGDQARTAKYLFLGNIHPGIQLAVLEQAHPDFVALDTMNLWIDSRRAELEQVLAKIDCLIINDEEAALLTGRRNLVQSAVAIQEMGPDIVVSKKGEHGCLLFEGNRIFSAPAFPMAEVVDPTGAGDTFAGGFMGYIAQQDSTDYDTLKRAVIHGSVVASYTCEAFGVERLAAVTTREIENRYDAFVDLSRF